MHRPAQHAAPRRRGQVRPSGPAEVNYSTSSPRRAIPVRPVRHAGIERDGWWGSQLRLQHPKVAVFPNVVAIKRIQSRCVAALRGMAGLRRARPPAVDGVRRASGLRARDDIRRRELAGDVDATIRWWSRSSRARAAGHDRTRLGRLMTPRPVSSTSWTIAVNARSCSRGRPGYGDRVG